MYHQYFCRRGWRTLEKRSTFFEGRKNSKKFVHSFFFTLKMHEHDIYFAQKWGLCSAFQKE